jgi:hypothetical protein
VNGRNKWMTIDDRVMSQEHGLTCGNRASNNNNNDHARPGLVFFIFFLLHAPSADY